jgi:hypothetical protein
MFRFDESSNSSESLVPQDLERLSRSTKAENIKL